MCQESSTVIAFHRLFSFGCSRAANRMHRSLVRLDRDFVNRIHSSRGNVDGKDIECSLRNLDYGLWRPVQNLFPFYLRMQYEQVEKL